MTHSESLVIMYLYLQLLPLSIFPLFCRVQHFVDSHISFDRQQLVLAPYFLCNWVCTVHHCCVRADLCLLLFSFVYLISGGRSADPFLVPCVLYAPYLHILLLLSPFLGLYSSFVASSIFFLLFRLYSFLSAIFFPTFFTFLS